MNEAHAVVDALLHCAVEGEATDPPASPIDGENWLIGSPATAEWSGHEGEIACRQAGNWIFIAPQDGLRILDRQRSQDIRYAAGWNIPVAPVEPTGGANVDAEARTAIAELIATLRMAGLIPAA